MTAKYSDERGIRTLTYERSEVLPTYGGMTVFITYTLTHVLHSCTNKYTITCKVMGLDDGRPYLTVMSVKYPTNTNEETLVRTAVEDMFDELTS